MVINLLNLITKVLKGKSNNLTVSYLRNEVRAAA